jgi:hypothetical protein
VCAEEYINITSTAELLCAKYNITQPPGLIAAVCESNLATLGVGGGDGGGGGGGGV